MKTIEEIRPGAAPALLPAAAVLAGTWAASLAGYLPLALLAALAALGLALSNRLGFTMAALALGLGSASLRPEAQPRIDVERPVEVVATVASHPLLHEDGEAFFHARTRSWRQDGKVARGAFDLQVTAPPGALPRAIGEVVRLRGYLRRPAGFANGPRQELGTWRLRLKSARFLSLEAPATGPAALVAGLRRRAEAAVDAAALDAAGPGRGTALVRALVLGDRTRLPRAWRQAMRRSGLAHVLAVSGLHVGLLALVLGIAGAALPRRLRYFPALAGITAYLALVGPQPAVMRASGMGLLALAALVLHRPPQGLNTLACCACLMAVHDPQVLGRIGFQLSAAATAGILILAPRYARAWTRLPAFWRQPLAVSAAAQLATLPWTLVLAGGVHPLAPLLNLAAIPYLAASLLASFAWLALALASGAVAAALAPALDALTWPLAAAAALPPSPALFLPLDVPTPAAALLWALAVATTWRPALAVRCGLAAWLLLQTGGGAGAGVGGRDVPELVAFDVGQGDGLLLRDGRHAALIDGGGWPHGDFGGRVLVPALATVGVRRLDALVLTHPDRDHCAGLVDVARYLPAREVWMGPGWVDDPCPAELLAATSGRWRVLFRGETERVGRWRVDVLHPEAGRRHGRNDRSLVLAAAAWGRRVLLTGDVEAAVERQLARHLGPGLRGEVLKVAHHGSKTSTTAELLAAFRPRLALISSGERNPHGHPHPAVSRRLQAAGARVLRTDGSGMIRLRFHPSGETSIELPGTPRRSRSGIR